MQTSLLPLSLSLSFPVIPSQVGEEKEERREREKRERPTLCVVLEPTDHRTSSSCPPFHFNGASPTHPPIKMHLDKLA